MINQFQLFDELQVSDGKVGQVVQITARPDWVYPVYTLCKITKKDWIKIGDFPENILKLVVEGKVKEQKYGMIVRTVD